MSTGVVVRERPLLMSGPMVLRTLADEKTQTRRVANPQPERQPVPCAWVGSGWALEGLPNEYGIKGCSCIKVKCPWREGERLWVRESIRPSVITYAGGTRYAVEYRADGTKLERPGHLVRDLKKHGDWTPSIHMPRWASRLTLELTEVRVERLNTITEADAIAEGMRQLRDDSGTWAGREGPGRLVTPWPTAREAFADVWDTINGRRPGCAWANSPWCWCLSFRQLTPTEAPK